MNFELLMDVGKMRKGDLAEFAGLSGEYALMKFAKGQLKVHAFWFEILFKKAE